MLQPLAGRRCGSQQRDAQALVHVLSATPDACVQRLRPQSKGTCAVHGRRTHLTHADLWCRNVGGQDSKLSAPQHRSLMRLVGNAPGSECSVTSQHTNITLQQSSIANSGCSAMTPLRRRGPACERRASREHRRSAGGEQRQLAPATPSGRPPREGASGRPTVSAQAAPGASACRRTLQEIAGYDSAAGCAVFPEERRRRHHRCKRAAAAAGHTAPRTTHAVTHTLFIRT